MRILFASLFVLVACTADAQLVWNQKMDEPSAILPLTLEDDVYRVRAKPPTGLSPKDISCEIGVTGTVLTDQRGTSAAEAAQKVVAGLRNNDDIDVQFADRVYSGNRDLVGNRVINKQDFDCGINIKYLNKLKVAEVDIRVGYVLPSGDIEGLTWAKLARKRRLLAQQIVKCKQYRDDIGRLGSDRSQLQSINPDNYVQSGLIRTKLNGIENEIRRKTRYANQQADFERDLAAFASIDEYLKTKINGCQVYVRFYHEDTTLPVDTNELRRARIRPIQVFEVGKDPILNKSVSE